MKIKHTRKALLMLSLGLISVSASAQKIAVPAASPLETKTQKFALGEVAIEYSRPAVKGRVIFGDVVPYGKVWRTGANATTKVTFSDDVTFEGVAVKAGTYGLYTVPNKESWEVMLYSDLTLGGNVADYKTEKEVARVKVKVTKLTEKVESFTIGLTNVLPTTANLTLSWENTAINVKLVASIEDRVMKSIDASINSDKPEYFRAASYYFENGKDLKKALEWVTKATEENPKAFWMTLTKAKIEYALKDKAAGKASAEKTIELAKEAKNDDYVAMATKLIADNK